MGMHVVQRPPQPRAGRARQTLLGGTQVTLGLQQFQPDQVRIETHRAVKVRDRQRGMANPGVAKRSIHVQTAGIKEVRTLNNIINSINDYR